MTLHLDPRNARRHSETNKRRIKQSLDAVGAGRSVLADADGIIRAGNGVFAEWGDKPVKIVPSDGSELVVVQRTDLRGKDAVRAAMLDNAAADTSAYDYDAKILAEIAKDDALVAALAKEDAKLAELLRGESGQGNGDNNYSRKIEAPIYTPKGEKPTIAKLYDDSKTKALIADIDASGLPDDEKAFLRIAAQRHTVLSFKLIADYYAHSEKPTQKLMEDSALVIIDFNRAIELGYVKIAEEIAKQYGADYGDA